ncbi:MAG: DUF1292 domain-containing protein [Lachnospiraceae bacterium]|nr:DUF1292 domain-containing protein [Lachnospiraceae bacterium]
MDRENDEIYIGEVELLDEDGQEATLYIFEEATLAGKKYYLATESEEEECEAIVLEEHPAEDGNEEDCWYSVVEDETLLDVLFDLFAELLSESGIELEK